MTIFYNNREVRLIKGEESTFRELQKLAAENPEVKRICRAGILVVFENSREAVVSIEELNFDTPN